MNFDIDIKAMKVLNIGNSSGIFSGENYHAQWHAMRKVNLGIYMSGDSNISNNSVNSVDDTDLFSIIECPSNLNKHQKQVKE